MSAKGNEGVAGRIKLTDGAIGYVEYGYAQRAGVPMARFPDAYFCLNRIGSTNEWVSW